MYSRGLPLFRLRSGVRGGYGGRMELTPDQIIRKHMADLGRKGGTARAAKLSPEKRKASAKKAARKRWAATRKKKVEKDA